jgi:hypothetical protein
VGIASVHQHHREERDAHDRITDGIGERRFDDAAQALSAYAARFGEPPDAPEIRDRVSMGKQAHNALSRARGLREAEDFRGAAAALSAIDPRTGYGTAVQEERGRLASDVRLAIERAVRERRCADAARLASALRAADPRSPAPPSCDDGRREAADARTNASDAQHAYAHRDFAHALESAQAALRDDPGLDAAWRIAGISACMTGNGEEAHRARPHLDRELQRSLDKLCHAHHVSGFGPSEAHESPSSPQPPAEPAMMRAREQIQRMLGTAEPFARKCFAKVPSYHPTMKVRVTAFPGSDHYVATAISTGPVEIRTCLEALFKPLHPPRVTAAISAERLYGSASDEE